MVVDSVVRDLDAMVTASSPNMRSAFRMLLLLVDWLPLLVVGAFARMHSMTLPERIHYLESLESCRIGILATLAVGLKLPVCMVAYEQQPGLSFTGFARPTLSTPRGSFPLLPPQAG
jgi:hypothetical protein